MYMYTLIYTHIHTQIHTHTHTHTHTYTHTHTQSALFNFQSLLVVILLLICTCAYFRSMFPRIIDPHRKG